ncbi:MAG: sialidase family protein [Gemmatimonadaceae bacterium]
MPSRLAGLHRLHVGLIFVACACAREASTPPITEFHLIPGPAGPQSGESSLAADATGTLHMTWLERLPDSSVALRYAQRSGERWDSTRTIAVRRDLFVNWADFPTVSSTASGRVLVHWLQRSTASKYSYDAHLVSSTDAGVSWSPPIRLHTDSSASEHGFVSFVPVADSAMAFWLDGRDTKGGEGHDHGAMQVRGASISRTGSLGPEMSVDARTCDCCQTAAALSARGPVVAYRDRSDDEVRDIVVSRLNGDAWTPAVKVHDDHWQIDACPVNGPAIFASGDTVAVAWFTAARDTAKVQLAVSTDAGATFGPPVRIDGGNPAGRVSLTPDGKGALIVAWVERLTGENAEVRARRVTFDGHASSPTVITKSSAARASGFPRLARAGTRLYASWTQPGDTARVLVAVAELEQR